MRGELFCQSFRRKKFQNLKAFAKKTGDILQNFEDNSKHAIKERDLNARGVNAHYLLTSPGCTVCNACLEKSMVACILEKCILSSIMTKTYHSIARAFRSKIDRVWFCTSIHFVSLTVASQAAKYT
jgi:hypothetical protein